MNYYINGEIGWEVKLDKIVKEWNQDITDVYINSIGGDVWEGVAIYNFLKEKKINTHTNGIVASIASIIFLSGKERIVNQFDDFLIHLPFSYGLGTSEDMQKSANELKKIENKLAKIYEAETSLTFDEALAQMKLDEMVNPEWLKEKGFVNEIKEFKAVAKFNYNNMSTNLTAEDKTWIEQGFASIKNLFKPKALKLQDANGVEIDFYELETDASPKVGDKARVDGKDAVGEYVMPSGQTYIFEAGALTEIKEQAGSDETAALKQENADLKAEIETLKAQASKKQTEFDGKLNDLQTKFTDFQNELKTKFNWDGRTEDPKPKARILK